MVVLSCWCFTLLSLIFVCQDGIWGHGAMDQEDWNICCCTGKQISFPLAHFVILYCFLVCDSIKHFRDFPSLVAWQWSHLLTTYSFLSSRIHKLTFSMTKDWQKKLYRHLITSIVFSGISLLCRFCPSISLDSLIWTCDDHTLLYVFLIVLKL